MIFTLVKVRARINNSLLKNTRTQLASVPDLPTSFYRLQFTKCGQYSKHNWRQAGVFLYTNTLPVVGGHDSSAKSTSWINAAAL